MLIAAGLQVDRRWQVAIDEEFVETPGVRDLQGHRLIPSDRDQIVAQSEIEQLNLELRLQTIGDLAEGQRE